MTPDPIHASQRSAAKVAGAAGLLSLLTVMGVNYGIVFRVLANADPPQMARNILAHQTLFRVGVVGDVLYGVELIVLSAALYVVLERASRLLALLVTLVRLVHAFIWLLISLNLLTALRLLSQPEYVRGVPPDQLPVLARLYLSGFDQYYLGLLFWSLGSTVTAWLLLRSRYVPRALAASGVLTGAWAAACTLCLFVSPDFAKVVGLSWFDVPMVLFEVALGVWLLSRGLRAAAPAPTDVGPVPPARTPLPQSR